MKTVREEVMGTAEELEVQENQGAIIIEVHLKDSEEEDQGKEIFRRKKERRDGSKPGFQGDCYKCNKPGHRQFECTSVENISNGNHYKTLYFNQKDGGYYNDNKSKDKFQRNGRDRSRSSSHKRYLTPNGGRYQRVSPGGPFLTGAGV